MHVNKKLISICPESTFVLVVTYLTSAPCNYGLDLLPAHFLHSFLVFHHLVLLRYRNLALLIWLIIYEVGIDDDFLPVLIFQHLLIIWY